MQRVGLGGIIALQQRDVLQCGHARHGNGVGPGGAAEVFLEDAVHHRLGEQIVHQGFGLLRVFAAGNDGRAFRGGDDAVAALVGLPSWSLTTFRVSCVLARLTIVLTKFLP